MKKITAVLFGVLWTSVLYAQLSPDTIASKVKDYHERNPQEKVYLDFDKTSYSTGDIIWFKSYLTTGYYNQLSSLSKVLYVELINPKGELVERLTVESDFGIGLGHFELNRDMPTGKYLVRAYTMWMRNFPSDYFYRKEINIFSVFETEKDLTENNPGQQDPAIRFFPEGGNLVQGLQSKVAFHATNQKGEGQEVKGFILTSKTDTVGTFKSTWKGMGSFMIMPDKGTEYHAVIEGHNKKYPLPNTYEKGQTMMLANIPGLSNIRFQVFNNTSDLNECVLFIHSRGLPLVAQAMRFSDQGILTGAIPKSIFQPGINHFTVFDAEGRPLVERLFFVDSIPNFDLQVKTNKSTYGTRQKVEIELSSELLHTIKQKGYLSLAATNMNEVLIDPEEDNILTNLHLTSDLKGAIEDPAAYFNGNEHNWKNLDLLMMTHGWRRFKWEQIFSQQANFDFPIEQALSLRGYLTKGLLNKKTEGSVTFNIIDSTNTIGKVITDKEGHFELPDLYFTGEKRIVVTGQSERGKENVMVQVDTIGIALPPTETPNGQIEGALTEWEDRLIKKSFMRANINASFDTENVVMLDEIVIEDQRIDRREELNKKVNNLYGKGDNTLFADEIFKNSPVQHPLEILRGRVSGVRVSGSINRWSVQIRGVGSINSGTQPLILVDNIPVPLDFLNSMPASMIKSVEIYKGPSAAVFGAQGANGAIAFFTKRGYEPKDLYKTDNSTIVKMKGYQDYMEFYSPDYSERKPEHIKPDKRATIHWKPLIETDENGKATLSFYTADEPMEIEIIIEGMTQSGLVTRSTSTIKVAKGN
jgi:hypothetical protein